MFLAHISRNETLEVRGPFLKSVCRAKWHQWRSRVCSSYGLTAELHSGQILDLQNTVKAMNALHDVAQRDLSTLNHACRNDFSKLDAACNACDAHNLVKQIGALEADMWKTHSDSLTYETRPSAVEVACRNDSEDLDLALQNVARETENNRQVINRAKELHKLQARLRGDIVPVADPQVHVVDAPAFLDRVDDVPVSRQRQTPMTWEVPKMVNSPRVQLIDKVVNVSHDGAATGPIGSESSEVRGDASDPVLQQQGRTTDH